MSRFVIQHHILPDGDEHWDLMLEGPHGLFTWSLPSPPDQQNTLPMTVRQLADHREAYLDYEGEVSGGRGRVEIHDRGTYCWRNSECAGGCAGAAGVASAVQNQPDIVDELTFEISGRLITGRLRLTRETQSGKDIWRLSRAAD